MKIILDVNIILSALIRDSITRKMILHSEFDLYFPEPSLHKIRKYKGYIIEKSGLKEKEYLRTMEILFKYIRLVPTEEIKKNWNKAKEIMNHIDQEDIIFIATALSLDNSIVWSDDKHFDKQNHVKVFKTKEIEKLIFLK